MVDTHRCPVAAFRFENTTARSFSAVGHTFQAGLMGRGMGHHPAGGGLRTTGPREKRWGAAAPCRVGRIEDDGATGGTGGGRVMTVGHGQARPRQIRFGSGLGRLGASAAQTWFRLDSGLGRLGAKAVQIWFIWGSDLVLVLLGLGQSRFRFGSGLDQLWFRVDSALARCNSYLVRCESYLVNRNIWFRCGSDLAPIWWWAGHRHPHTGLYAHVHVGS